MADLLMAVRWVARAEGSGKAPAGASGGRGWRVLGLEPAHAAVRPEPRQAGAGVGAVPPPGGRGGRRGAGGGRGAGGSRGGAAGRAGRWGGGAGGRGTAGRRGGGRVGRAARGGPGGAGRAAGAARGGDGRR